jgi:anti-anti-sigma factor
MSKKPIIQFSASQDEARKCWTYVAKGKFIGCEICYDFLDEARDNITVDMPHVVMDLSGVTMLNSTGIGIIASLLNVTKEKDGKVYLTGATGAARRPLQATHMWGFLQTCESLDQLPESL